MLSKLNQFLEQSFLSPLLENSNVTDISFNGEKIFYEDKKEGRKPSSILITNEEANNFVRQIANLSEKQFSFSSPILDVSFGKYRFNAVHSSITRFHQNKCVSFCIRIASYESEIEKDKQFCPKYFIDFIKEALKNKRSIIIGGKTGVGKTELQKFILNLMPSNHRVILIDQIDEIGYSNINSDVDITHWVSNPQIEDSKISNLISNALRCNPDWIIISESRGKEMSDVLLSSMSGHPIITTIHAKNGSQIIPRIIRMIYLKDKISTYQEIEEEIYSHFDYFILLKKKIDKKGKIQRFIHEIYKSDENKKQLKSLFKSESINNLNDEIKQLKGSQK